MDLFPLYKELLEALAKTRDQAIERMMEVKEIIAQFDESYDEAVEKKFMVPSDSIRTGPTLDRTMTFVRPGDTMWALAEEHDVDWIDLLEWNDMDESSFVYPGQAT